MADQSNDGFIPRFAQFRKPSEIGGFPIEGTANAPANVYEFSSVLHASSVDINWDARSAPGVWGTGEWNEPIPSGTGMTATNGTIPYLYSKMANNPELSQADRTAWWSARDNFQEF